MALPQRQGQGSARRKVLGRTVGPVGYLALELSHEFPALLKELQTGG